MKKDFFKSLLTIVLATAFSVSTFAADGADATDPQKGQLSHKDSDFGCTDAALAQKYIKDFNIDVKSFGGLELCNSQVDTKKLLNDMYIVEKGEFKADGNNLFVKGFVPANNYYAWSKSQTYGIERGQDVPYATAYNSGGYFTMQDGWAKLSTLGRVGTFIHEARHTAGYRHIVCNQGPYQGSSVSGCDTNYNYGGSHAVEMEYYARVSVQGVNFHPVYQKMARLMAIGRSNIFFNTSPIQKREGLLALTVGRDQAVLFENGKQPVIRELPDVLVEKYKLKMTSFGAVLFDGVRALSIEMYQNSGFKDPVEDVYSYFKLLLDKPLSLVDLEEFDQGIKRYVVRITTDNKLATYNFPNGTWGRDQALPFQVKKTSTAIPGVEGNGYFITTTTDEVYRFIPDTARLVKQNVAARNDYVKVVAQQNKQFVLKNDSKIYVIQNGSETPFADSDQNFSDLVSVPLYDGFEVVR